MPHSLPRALLLGLALAGPAAYGESRDDAPARADIFDVIADHREPSTATFGQTTFNLPGSDLGADSMSYSVEASIAPAFTLFRAEIGGPLAGSYLLDVVPKFVVRRWDGIESNPVRTPSYMPYATLFYAPRAAAADSWYLSFTGSHYSNGETGTFLRADGSGPNDVDGSFSLWTAAVALHLQNDWPLLPRYKALRLEYVFNKESTLDALYPDYVISLTLHTAEHRHEGWMGLGGRSRALIDLDWRVRKHNSLPDAWKPAPFSAALTAAWSPQWMLSRADETAASSNSFRFGDFAFFGRLYTGFDYYNMNFDKEIYRVDFGLMLNPHGG